MKYVVTNPIVLFNGQTAKVGEDAGSRDMTLRDALELACLNPSHDLVKTGEQKFKLFLIVDRVHKQDEVELSAEEVVLIKQVAGALFTVAMVGAIYKALEAPGA